MNGFERYYNNLEVLSVNAEEPRAYFIPYANRVSAKKLDRNASPYFKSLCGDWNFTFFDSVNEITEEDLLPEYEFPSDTVTVPQSWQSFLGRGYDTPNYVNVSYPFPADPPHIPDNNPCGLYSRAFYLSEGFAARELYLNFEGVDSCFYVWVNGEFVGYSTVSHCTSEFYISPFTKTGRNEIKVLVVKLCAGSYLEDQDKYRFSGIFREVYILARAKSRIKDFYIRTTVSDDLKKAVINLDIQTVGRPKVQYEIFSPDGELVSEGTYKNGVKTEIDDPLLWNDEQPYLYQIFFTCGDEVIFQNIAIKKAKIEGKIFFLNGKKIKLRGVNRHDSHPILGSTTPFDHFLRDLEILKSSNVNSIRTSHYPSDPRFVELCDIYGFYIIDEADLETHGMCMVSGIGALSDDPAWEEAYVNRARKLFERDKNRGCVIMWSLGNESGGGINHVKMREYIKSRDESAIIHYEGARAPFTEKAEYEAVTDVRSEMYTSPEYCLARIKDKSINKPFYLCEYLHAMGNGPGGIKEYIDLIRSHDEFMGGNVWEYCDHSVLVPSEDGKKHYTYGGDFGDFPSDGNFCVDGLVYPDRRESNGMRAIKNAYMPAEIELIDCERGEIEVKSYKYFTSLSDTDLAWNVECNGRTVKSGRIAALAIQPGRSRKFRLFDISDFGDEGEYFLNVRLITNSDKDGVQAGSEIGARQFELFSLCIDQEMPESPFEKKTEYFEDEGFVEIDCDELSVYFDKAHGRICSIVHDGREMLAEPIRINMWRAPTDNDRNIRHEWQKTGFDKLVQITHDCGVYKATDQYVTLYAYLTLGAPSIKPAAKVREYITVSDDGTISFEFEVDIINEKIDEIPRFGLEIVMPEGSERVEYFGMGPYEAYSDHKYQSRVGYFKTTATDNFEHYIKPQENSSHCDTRYAFVGNRQGHGLEIMKFYDSENISFNAQHYSAKDLTNTLHDYELKERKETYVYADMRMTGIGSNSCGPRTFEKYRFTDKNFRCAVIIKPTHIQ